MKGEAKKQAQLKTDPISAERIRVFQQGLQQGPSMALLLIHRDGMAVAPLDTQTALVIGRAGHADICIPDDTLSGEHARVSLVEGGALIEDLGSTNGVWQGSERTEQVLLAPGGEAMLGGVLVRLRGTGAKAEDLWSNAERDGLVAGEALRPVLAMAKKVARSRASVVVLGETGSGKELLARYLHTHSPRAKAPLVSVNCGAIPATLVESTLFGHERGAFTGAHQQQKGVFERADGGSVFLDEVGELPMAAQAALLRVLESGCYSRVGSVKEQQVDVRVIAATHRDLLAMSQDGSFRADLYYRLCAVTLPLPPLRERRDEIAPLAAHFLQQANEENERAITGISAAALQRLEAYAWPGNVRELRNVIERGVIICDGAIVDIGDLPPLLRQHTGAAQPSSSAPPPTSERSLRDRVHDYEAQLIVDALEQSHYNRRKAAELLQIPVRTLSHKIKTLGLEVD